MDTMLAALGTTIELGARGMGKLLNRVTPSPRGRVLCNDAINL